MRCYNMERLWCHNCQKIQNTDVSVIENNIEVKKKKILQVTKSYICSVCHMFIKSDDKRIEIK